MSAIDKARAAVAAMSRAADLIRQAAEEAGEAGATELEFDLDALAWDAHEALVAFACAARWPEAAP